MPSDGSALELRTYAQAADVPVYIAHGAGAQRPHHDTGFNLFRQTGGAKSVRPIYGL
jgi:hypothetical protein